MTSPFTPLRSRIAGDSCLWFILFALWSLTTGAAAGEKLGTERTFDIPALDGNRALTEFAAQSGVDVMYGTASVAGIRTKSIKGQFIPRAALAAMLEGTGLSVEEDRKSGGLLISRESKNGPRTASGNDRPESNRDYSERKVELPAFEVMGNRLLNMDIPRGRDGPQPYVVFERGAIERSGAINLEDFLKQRLTMNTVAGTQSQSVSSLQGNMSQVNLRGLGAGQTLILIDGHRVTGANFQGAPSQPDLNGVPLSAIERIEVLPTTASAIYGGSATGGVINIILRRDYQGAELRLSYENTFSSDAALRRVDLNAGFTLEGGRTSVLLAFSLAEQAELLAQDRNLIQRGRARILAHNPNFILTAANPPLGATPNYRSVSGVPLFGAGTPNFATVPAGYNGSGGLAGLQPGAGRYNLDLSGSAQASGGRQGLMNGPSIESFMATIRREFSPRVQGFVEVAGSNNESFFVSSQQGSLFTLAANAPGNPFGPIAVRVNVPSAGADSEVQSTSSDRRIVAGVIIKLPGDWTAEADCTWNRTRFSYSVPGLLLGTEAAAITSGALNLLRDTAQFPVDFSPYLSAPLSISPLRSTLRNAALRASGPVGSLPTGRPTVSALLERRDETFGGGYQYTPFSTLYFPSRSQKVDSAYAESVIPLLSADPSRDWFQSAELQLAARHDRYQVNGVTGSVVAGSTTPILRSSQRRDSTNPMVGVRVAALPDVALRGSYGTGFLPPSVNQLQAGVPQNNASGGNDLRRGNTLAGPYQLLTGGNAGLGPEKSESWSAGVILQPRWSRGLRLSVDYTWIHRTDNITTLTAQQTIDNEAFLPGRITRAAPAPGDPFGVGVIAVMDRTFVNISEGRVEAFDFSADYRWESADWGKWDFYAAATRQTHYTTRIAPSLPWVENVGISTASPLPWKANAGISWTHGPWFAGWSARYFDSYLVSTNAATILNQGAAKVRSQDYHDVFIGYRCRPHAGVAWKRWLDRLEAQVGVKNVLNTRPPFDASVTEYYSRYGDPRLSSYHLSCKKAF